MKKKCYLKKIFVIGIILLFIPIFPVGLSSNTNIEEKQLSNKTLANHYENSIVVIIGKCNIVQGPLVWIFGLYIPLIKRSFLIRANGGEGEQLNVIVRGDKFATYIDNEDIIVDVNRAHGILFWGQKSLLTNSSRIFVRCKAENIWITAYD